MTNNIIKIVQKLSLKRRLLIVVYTKSNTIHYCSTKAVINSICDTFNNTQCRVNSIHKRWLCIQISINCVLDGD